MNAQMVILATIGVVVLLVFASPYFTGEAKAEKRRKAIAGTRTARVEQDTNRRRSVADSLKALDDKHAKKRITIEEKIEQAGLEWTKAQFILFSCAMAVVGWIAVLMMTLSIAFSLFGLIIGGLGMPTLYLAYRKKKRLDAFVEGFPAALDIIIRGVKAGLPLGECLKVIANESPDPIGSEFKAIIEGQQMGLTLSETTQRMALRIPCPESNFFSIALSIQQKSGGNLSETLGNLARVLRERKKMKMKIKAMSMEAIASAGIIACMPPGVALMVYLSSPDYISLLWTTTTGQITLACCAIWMAFGILVMRKMINFEV